MTHTFTDYMYGPLRFTRTDLVATTIQRGRDFGLRSYTEMRKALDLPPVKTFAEINPELNRTNPQVNASVRQHLYEKTDPLFHKKHNPVN